MGKRLERWITCLIAELNEHVDEETRAKVLERCGRQCQSQSFTNKARDIYQKSENIDEFLDNFGQVYKHLHRKGDEVYIVYPKCYCSHVNKIPPRKVISNILQLLSRVGQSAVRRSFRKTSQSYDGGINRQRR